MLAARGSSSDETADAKPALTTQGQLQARETALWPVADQMSRF